MKIRLDIAYDGRNFYGSQRQKNHRTVQGEVEQVLGILYQTPISLQFSGRTDGGVHALKQVGHFSPTLEIPLDRLHYALSSLLPSDIQLLEVAEGEDSFHARFSAKEKTYRYVLTTKDDVFTRPYRTLIKKALDFSRIDVAIGQLVGEHDFYSFSNRRAGETSTIRNLREISYREDGDTIIFTFRGDGFLYKMVRILMQYLIHVGQSKLEPEKTGEILLARSREFTRQVAPPQGLYLVDIDYGQDENGN